MMRFLGEAEPWRWLIIHVPAGVLGETHTAHVNGMLYSGDKGKREKSPDV